MKNSEFTKIFESVNNVLNETKKERKEWHSKDRTLSRFLRVSQSKEFFPLSKPIFEAAGIPTTGKVKPSEFLALVVNFVEIKGVKTPAYLREVTVYQRDEEGKIKKDKEGNRVPERDEEGKIKKELVLTPIKEGTWTLEKVIKAVAK